MSTHTVADAKSHLLSLIERALAGESVVIERDGQPAVELRAAAYMRRLDLNLRPPDALNIAIAHRLSVTLVSLTIRWRLTPGCWGFQWANVRRLSHHCRNSGYFTTISPTIPAQS